MTPAQQAALETVAGRELTPEELTAIEPYLVDRNDVQIAALLPARMMLSETTVGVGTILAKMYPAGGAFLDSLQALGQTDSNVKWALKLIEGGNLDVGHPLYRGILQQFAAAAPPFADGIALLLSVAERSNPVTASEVSIALNGGEA